MAAAKILVATESFVTTHDGREVLVSAGTRVRANHTLAKAYPDLFEPLEPRPDIEQATASPGEKRGARARAKR